MMKKVFNLIFSILLFASIAQAQAAEVTVSLSEQFFDSLFEAIFKNFNAPEFPLAANNSDSEFQIADSKLKSQSAKFGISKFSQSGIRKLESGICNESIRLLREGSGVKTAVRFRDGKIYAPIAFSGSYNPPLIGCLNFQGWAETNIVLDFDRQNQKLFGRVEVLNVQLNGTGGVGSALVTKLVQNSIDRRINPVEILPADKLSFVVPLQNSGGALRMKAAGIRHEIRSGALDIRINYEFLKAE